MTNISANEILILYIFQVGLSSSVQVWTNYKNKIIKCKHKSLHSLHYKLNNYINTLSYIITLILIQCFIFLLICFFITPMCQYILVVCIFAYNYINDIAKSDRHIIQYKEHTYNTMYIVQYISPHITQSYNAVYWKSFEII